MGKTQILKLVFFAIIVLCALAFFVVNFVLGKMSKVDYRDKKTRVLLRIRVGLFLGMLVSLLLIVILT